MVASVEEVSSSLVREYLSKKGLKRTMACMDEEHPRTDDSINNRSQLRQMLCIDDLYKKNKDRNSPLKTLLEILIKHHMEQLKQNKITRNKCDSQKSSASVRLSADSLSQSPLMIDSPAGESTPILNIVKEHLRSATQESCASKIGNESPVSVKSSVFTPSPTGVWNCDFKDQPLMVSPQDNESVILKEQEKHTSIPQTTQRSRNNRIRRGMMAGPIPQDSNRKRHSRKAEVSRSLLMEKEENGQSGAGLFLTGLHQKHSESSITAIGSADWEGDRREVQSAPGAIYSRSNFEEVEQIKRKTRKLKLKLNVADFSVADMMLDDIDDDEDLQELSKGSVLTSPAKHSFAGHPIDQHTATELKVVLLGSSLSCFSVEWRSQSFTFSETLDLRYGIVQKKGGPCGVLASVQAFVLKILLFEDTESSNKGLQRLKPSNGTRRRCLVLAVAEILWRAGGGKRATVAINSGKSHFIPTGLYKSEGVLEKITCFTVDNSKDLQFLLEQHIDQFETGLLGCLLLTISAVLSRSIEKVREDMDVSTTTLIGAHGYCTQELVNLLLCGTAVSNVFDNDMELDSGNDNLTLLKGIKSHCDVGLLSLFEHYNICKVGTHLKSPLYPIWVVCSESHFSVLFGLQRALPTSKDKGLEFDLYYYDGLANQQEEIRLTVSVGKFTASCHDVDTDLIPPLDLCIRTRWKDASVNWNDTEPIL